MECLKKDSLRNIKIRSDHVHVHNTSDYYGFHFRVMEAHNLHSTPTIFFNQE